MQVQSQCLAVDVVVVTVLVVYNIICLCTDVGTTSLNAILPADEASVGNYQVEVLGVMR